jgi:hypothetical protein
MILPILIDLVQNDSRLMPAKFPIQHYNIKFDFVFSLPKIADSRRDAGTYVHTAGCTLDHIYGLPGTRVHGSCR